MRQCSGKPLKKIKTKKLEINRNVETEKKSLEN